MFCCLVVIGRCILIDFDRYILCFCDHYVRLCVVFFTTPLHTVKCTLIAKTSVFTEQDDRCGNSSTQSQAPEDGYINRLKPNDPYMGRTAQLTSKRCILCIYSTNVGTEYFKHALYSRFFSLQNAVCFIMPTCLVPALFTFYIQNVLKLKKNNSGAKGLIYPSSGACDCVDELPHRSSCSVKTDVLALV